MSPGRSPFLAFAALVFLALFAALFTAGETLGIWPQLPPGSFQNVELVAGFAGLVAILFALARRGRHLR